MEVLKGQLRSQWHGPSEPIIDRDNFVDDLNMDSLDLVELLMEVEAEFDLEISDEDAERVTTVGEAVELLELLITGKVAR